MENQLANKNHNFTIQVQQSLASCLNEENMMKIAAELSPNLKANVNTSLLIAFNSSFVIYDMDEEYQDIPCADLNVANIWIEIDAALGDYGTDVQQTLEARLFFTELGNLIVTFIGQIQGDAEVEEEDDCVVFNKEDSMPTPLSEVIISSYENSEDCITTIGVHAKAAVKKLLGMKYKVKNPA